jgi:membrane protein
MPNRIAIWRKRAEDLHEQQEEIDASQRTLRAAYLSALRTEAQQRAPGRGGFAGWLHRHVVVPGVVVTGRVGLDDLGTHSGALTYASLIAIPPLMLFVLSIASFFLKGNQQQLHDLINAIAGIFPGKLEEAVHSFLSQQLDTAMNARVTVGIIGIVGLLWTASSLASRIRHALGEIFATRRTGILTGRPAGMVIGALVVAAIVGVMLLSAVKSWLHGLLGTSVASATISELGLVVGSFVFFLVLYRVLTPGEGPSLRGHIPGTIVFVVALAGLEALGGLYFSNVVAQSTALYGALGALFGVVAFVYSTSWLLLLGAEISAELWTAPPGQLS